LLAVGVGTIGLFVLLVLWIARKHREAERLRAQLAIMKATAKVAGLEADKKTRKVELRVNKKASEALGREITEAKKEAIAAVKEVEGMSDVEVAMEFKKLGF
jgi:hypothetical protein